MEYCQALDYLNNRKKLGMKPGLDRIKKLLKYFGDPQENLPAVHVAGTNGKGSTCAYIESILRHSGYKTGLFTSPFLLSPCEMIKVNGIDIDPDSFAALVNEASGYCGIMDEMGEGPSEYEIYTAAALAYFKRSGCRITVIEVCMGGRFDCTNILTHVEVSVITKISRDHTEYLGKTLADIAWHKAGIIKPGIPVVSWPQETEAMETINKIADQNGSHVYVPDFRRVADIFTDKNGNRFDYGDFKSLKIRMPGEHQVHNAVAAIQAVSVLQSEGWAIDSSSIREGLSNTRWPARFEFLRENPDFILDCAHNTDGVMEFVRTYRTLYGEKKAAVIFGVMRDKDYEEMIRLLSSISDSFHLYKPENDRALSLDKLKETADKYCGKVTRSDTINDVLVKCMDIAQNCGVICALGSIYYAGSMREAVIHFG